MNTTLKTARDAWKVKTNYDRDTIPEVWTRYREYRDAYPDKYPYNADILAFVVERDSVPSELHDQLDIEVYLAQQQQRRNEEAIKVATMRSDGFIPASEIGDYRGAAELKGTVDMDFMSVRVATTGKIITDGHGEPFFIPKGNRSRGHRLSYNDKLFIKIIK